MGDVGIKVNVVNVEWADWIANVFQGAYDYDLTMVSHVEANDFGSFGKPGYYLNYKNAPALNALLAKLAATTPTPTSAPTATVRPRSGAAG